MRLVGGQGEVGRGKGMRQRVTQLGGQGEGGEEKGSESGGVAGNPLRFGGWQARHVGVSGGAR